MTLTIGYPKSLTYPFDWDALGFETRLETFDELVDLLQRLSEVLPAAIVIQSAGGLTDVLKMVRVLRRHADVPVHLVLQNPRREVDPSAVPGIASVHDVNAGYGRLRQLLSGSRFPVPQRTDASIISVGELCIDLRRRKASVFESDLRLTRKEFDILQLLASERDVIIKRQRVIDVVWGLGWVGVPNVLDTHVVKLRAKLSSAGATAAIINVRGVGFYLDTSEMSDLGVLKMHHSA
jgi:DNA-binding winged helix-turn-helix (wHTH) protein